LQPEAILENVSRLSQEFAANRRERQLRRHLEPADFKAIADCGYLLVGVPESMGGIWRDAATSNRAVCEILRTLARGDPSVALVSSMHSAVLSFWLNNPVAPEPYAQAWSEQCRFVAQTALDGHFWGTITSEPGSGGDVTKTRTIATPQPDGGYRLKGQKHFGSGSGITSYMITTARPEDEEDSDSFFLDVRDAKWDGSGGMKLVAEWDGHGMIATQSHAFDFDGYPATRLAWHGMMTGTFGGSPPIFTAVVVGTVQSAVEAARAQILRKKDSLRPYEEVEWARVEQEAWTIDQAYEGMLRAVETRGAASRFDASMAKLSIAELAESVTQRICRVIGGGSFARTSHFGAAFEDVRALGFLRPPWNLAYDTVLSQVAETQD
jgi:alkylation response protein AidB-like acyl-CoA dehydrogenase